MTKKAENNRDKIIEAARTVVSKIGVKNTTLQTVADAAGISKGALYYYYKTKDEILYDVMEQDNVESIKMVKLSAEKAKDKEGLIEAILKGILIRIDDVDKNKLSLYLQGEALQGNEDLQRNYAVKYKEWIRSFEKIVMELYEVDAGPITRVFSSLALAAIEGMSVQRLLLGDEERNDEILKGIIKLILTPDMGKVRSLAKGKI
ncbi:MAG: TetR/AcrR family transcriptional regulator [bacterium]|nr:TetR/AcrR family transcriptional regulator [bacterium]